MTAQLRATQPGSDPKVYYITLPLRGLFALWKNSLAFEHSPSMIFALPGILDRLAPAPGSQIEVSSGKGLGAFQGDVFMWQFDQDCAGCVIFLILVVSSWVSAWLMHKMDNSYLHFPCIPPCTQVRDAILNMWCILPTLNPKPFLLFSLLIVALSPLLV